MVLAYITNIDFSLSFQLELRHVIVSFGTSNSTDSLRLLLVRIQYTLSITLNKSFSSAVRLAAVPVLIFSLTSDFHPVAWLLALVIAAHFLFPRRVGLCSVKLLTAQAQISVGSSSFLSSDHATPTPEPTSMAKRVRGSDINAETTQELMEEVQSQAATIEELKKKLQSQSETRRGLIVLYQSRYERLEQKYCMCFTFCFQPLIIIFCGCTPHSCDADSDATVPGELHNVDY